jgi:hypothetical protein
MAELGRRQTPLCTSAQAKLSAQYFSFTLPVLVRSFYSFHAVAHAYVLTQKYSHSTG